MALFLNDLAHAGRRIGSHIPEDIQTAARPQAWKRQDIYKYTHYQLYPTLYISEIFMYDNASKKGHRSLNAGQSATSHR